MEKHATKQKNKTKNSPTYNDKFSVRLEVVFKTEFSTMLNFKLKLVTMYAFYERFAL